MKVEDLVALLQTMPRGARVVLKGYENGLAEVSGIRERPIRLDVHPEWWNGPHEVEEDAPDEVAIEIVRIDREPP